VDVSAPGDSVITTYGPKWYWATFRFNLVQGGATNYGRAGAVSAASPIVTGIIALMLEMDPSLDAAQIKRVLQETARADAFTGEVPNPNWGYGKVDALAALDRVHDNLTRLRIPATDSSVFQITSRGQNGKPYVLESSTNLTNWTRVSTNLAGTNAFHIHVTNTAPASFFRLTR
jgi:subtilisin family serine protease